MSAFDPSELAHRIAAQPPAGTDIDLSIAIPAYNEEAVIEATVDALITALSPTGWRFEIVVADDMSTDRTWDLLQEIARRHPELRPIRNEEAGGYGMAVKAALRAGHGRAMIVAMADGSDLPEDVVAYGHAMLEGGYACAFGSRFGKDDRVTGYPPVKRVLNRMGNRLLSWVTRHRYDDFTNGFKGYRREVLAAMEPLVAADFNLTVEMSMKAVFAGASYTIIDNGWRDREGGVSKFRVFKLGSKYLLTILYCWLGAYLRHLGARPRHRR